MALDAKDTDRLPIYFHGIAHLAFVCFPTMNPKNARRAVFRALSELEAAQQIERGTWTDPKTGKEKPAYLLTFGSDYGTT